MTRAPAAFAIPGDLETLTGGYIYEKRLLLGLRDLGHDVSYIPLGASYPAPTAADMTDAVAALTGVSPDRVLILDGFVSGATDTAGLARVRAPMVAMVHHPLAMETGLTEAQRTHLHQTERANLALMAHVLVPSPHTASLLVDRYGVAPDRITIARPGTDGPMQGATRPAEPPLILSVGTLHPRKGHDTLLRALAQIAGSDWQAVIAGSPLDPGHAADLERLRDSLGLKDRVRFAGRVERAELDALYRQASIFALATLFEGYGIVFDEALAHGLPIVTCDTGAVPDTVPSEAGLLVPPGDADAFAQALNRLVGNRDLRDHIAREAAHAGRNLPSWADTARVAGGVLDSLYTAACRS